MGTPTYHLYLDDSGTRFPDRKVGDRLDSMDYFALGGVLIKSENVEEAKQAHASLCSRYGIDGPLHSNSIRCRKNHFRWLESNRERAAAFYDDLTELICTLKAHATGCVVNRPGYNLRYGERYRQEPWKLCKSAYTIVVERAAKIAHREKRKLVVYVEQSGKHEDRAIVSYHSHMRDAGMFFDATNSAKYTPAGAGMLASTLFSKPNFVTKSHPLCQLSDLMLYPIVKAAYSPDYPPYKEMLEAGTIIDTVLTEADRQVMGIKYFCFDQIEK